MNWQDPEISHRPYCEVGVLGNKVIFERLRSFFAACQWSQRSGILLGVCGRVWLTTDWCSLGPVSYGG